MAVRAAHAVVWETGLRQDEGALADDLRGVAIAVSEDSIEHVAVTDDGAERVGLQATVRVELLTAVSILSRSCSWNEPSLG